MKALDRLEDQMNAGTIKRYHTTPIVGEQTVGHHTYNVCQIIRFITEDAPSVSLLMAALDHDVAEWYTGDVPFTAKRENKDLAKALRTIEEEIETRVGLLHALSPEEKRILKWADMIDAGMFGMYQYQLGNRAGLKIIENIVVALEASQVSTNPRAARLAALIKGHREYER